MPVVFLDVVAKTWPDAIEHPRVHDKSADVARKIVGRASQQSMRPRRDAPVRLETLLQVFAVARQQEIAREGLAILLKRHHRAVLRGALSVIDHREGTRGV